MRPPASRSQREVTTRFPPELPPQAAVQRLAGRPQIARPVPGERGYVRAEVAPPGEPPYNPAGDGALFAFLPYGVNPGPSDWNGGTWVTAPSGYLAQILIGPRNNGVALPAGAYQIWLSVTDSPEVPVMQAGTLQIT